MEQKLTRAEDHCESFRRDLGQEQSMARAAQLRLQELEEKQDAARDYERKLLAAEELARGFQEQLSAEQVCPCNSSGAAREALLKSR